MSTFANHLKGEIARIGKKEVRSETRQIKQASTKYRSEITAQRGWSSHLDRFAEAPKALEQTYRDDESVLCGLLAKLIKEQQAAPVRYRV